MLQQIFGADDYGKFLGSNFVNHEPRIIVDCGANIGLSSVYFLERFKSAHLLAIEPDAGNFEVLKRNLDSYGGRVTIWNNALWATETILQLRPSSAEEGNEWGRQYMDPNICEQVATGAVVQKGTATATMESVIRWAGGADIDLLKIDIEGAEVVVFGCDCSSWLPRVHTIAIELHDHTPFGAATEVFLRAVPKDQYYFGTQGELTICSRKPPRDSPSGVRMG